MIHADPHAPCLLAASAALGALAAPIVRLARRAAELCRRLDRVEGRVAGLPDPTDADPYAPRADSSLDAAAVAWLRFVLEQGELDKAAIFRQGEAAGLTRMSLYRASGRLGVQARKLDGAWTWFLPELAEDVESIRFGVGPRPNWTRHFTMPPAPEVM